MANMARTNKLSKIFVVLLFVVVVAALTFALAAAMFFGVDWQSRTTAVAASVFEENTATYSYINDTSNTGGYNTLWQYNRTSNYWQNSGETAQKKIETTLTLDILTSGNVAFQWLISSWRDPSDKNYTEAYFKVIKVTGEQQDAAYEKNPVTAEYKQKYSETVVIPVTAGDKLKFVVKSNYGTNSGYFQIKGLNVPTETFDVVAQVAPDSVGNGTIKTDKEEEIFADNKITAVRGYNEKFVFTAIPNEGYVAYWTRNESYVKTGNEYTIYHPDTVVGDPFVVHFVKSDSEDIIISFDKPQDNEMGWEETTEGTYNISNVAEQKGATTFKEKLLSFGFVGERWISLDCLYDIVDDSNVSVSPYLDGSSYFDLRLQGGEKGKTNLLCAHVTGSGFHYLEFDLHPSGASSSNGTVYDVKGTEKVTLRNFNFSREKLVTDMSVKYNSDFAELYLDGQPCDVEGSSGIVNQTISVPLAGAFNLEVRPKTNITSSLDESKTTTSQFVAGTVNGKNTNPKATTEVVAFEANAQSIVKFAITRKSPIDFQIQTRQNGKDNGLITLKLNEGETNLELDLTYKELAVAPNISATKNSEGNNIGDYDTIEEGQFLGFPFRKENSLTLNIQKFEGFEPTDYSIVVNMVEMNGSLQEVGDMLILPIVVNSNSEVMISFTKEDTDLLLYSSYNLTFSVGENPIGEDKDDTEVSNILHLSAEEAGVGQLAFCNMAKVFDANNKTGDYKAEPWKFDAALSEEENYVYTTSLDFEKTARGYYRPKTAVKILAFELEGADKGSLTFQFKVSGYNNFQDISGAYRGGLLGAYTQSEIMSDGVMGWPFSTENIKKICGSSDGINYTDPTGGILLAKPISNGMEYGGNVIMLADGWCQASIPIAKGPYSGAPSICLAFITCYEGMAAYPLESLPSASFSIRNVHLITGDKNATLNVCDEAGDAKVTAKIGESEYHAGDSFTATAGSTVELSVDKQGKQFYGWTVNGSLVSTEETTKIFLNGESNIKAWIADAGTYEARADGVFYTTIKKAVESAEFGQTVYVVKDNAKITEGFEIGKGVTLLLPYSTACKSTETGTPDLTSENRIAWFSDKKAEYRYLTVTVQENVTITVKGTLVVGGIINHPNGQGYQGHTSGAYAELILEKGSLIQVASGGVMDVYGRVWGGEGKQNDEMGSIDVADGGKLYEPFLILDFDGGSNTLGLFSAGHTPFKRYAMINIEVPMTINYGGELLGHASLWVETMKLLAALDQPFISAKKESQNDTFVMLSEGAKVTITYDPTRVVDGNNIANCTEGIGKIKMVFDGGAKFSYMLFSAMGLTVPTNPVYFSIPYNYEIEFNGDGAQYETLTDFMIMPGASVTVGAKATLTLNANAWVLDGLVQKALSKKSYPEADQLEAANYSKNGNLIVNGTLKIGRKTTVQEFDIFGSSEFNPEVIGATFLGVVQTNGSGKIEIPHADTKLAGKITDGLNSNYFEYTTSARVWDAAHNCFGNLAAGKTYTATGDETFNLGKLLYATTEGGDQNNELDLSNQTLHGSWMEVHEGHNFDWTPNPDKDKLTGDSTVISRQCSVMGCDHEEKKLLLGDAAALNSGVFKGTAYNEADLLKLLKDTFGITDEALQDIADFGATFKYNGGEIGENLLNVQSDPYGLVITLTNGVWLIEGAYNNEKTLTFKIDPFDLTENYEELQGRDIAALTYNGTAQQPELTLTLNGYTLQYVVDYGELVYASNTNAGDATITVTGTGNFKGSFTINFTINPAKIDGNYSMTVNDDLTYNGTEQTPNDFTFAGALEDYIKSSDYTVTKVENATNATSEGSKAKVTLTFEGGNFTGTLTAEFEIGKKDITISVDADQSKTYGENDPTFTWTVNAQDLAQADRDNGETEYKQLFAVKLQRATGENVNYGGYAITGTATADNYNVTVTSAQFTINPKPITVTLSKQTWATYNGAAQNASSDQQYWSLKQAEGNAMAYSDQPTALNINLAATGTDAGSYDITPTWSNKNYTVTFEYESNALTDGKATGAFVIGKEDVTITIDSASSAQGDEPKKDFTYQVTKGHFYGDDKVTFDNLRKGYKCDATSDAEVNKTFDITMEFNDGTTEEALKNGTAMKNYRITIVKGTYTITESVYKNIKVRIKDAETDSLTITYDGKTHTLEVSGLSPEDANNATYEFTLNGETFNGAKDADTYNIKVKITVSGHAPLEKDVILKIEKKAIHVKAEDISITYGDEDKELTWSVKAEDLAEADKDLGEETYRNLLDIKLSREQGNTHKDGGYKITGTGTAKNYSITVDEGIYTINKKDISTGKLTVTGTYTYNGQAHVPTWNELILGEIKNAQDGNVTISESDVTITASENVNAGTNTATVTVEGQGNFTGKLTANFSIGKAAATVSITKAEGTYGDEPATMKFTVEGNYGETDKGLIEKAVKIAHKATKESAVGTYDVTVTFDTLTNYTVSVKDNSDKQAYEVKAKGVTVTLLKQEWATYNYKVQNAKSDSEYIALKAGSQLANDEKLSDLKITLTANGMNAGSYDITPTWNNNNYNVTFEYGDKTLSKEEKATGAFVIGKATITVTVQSASTTYGDEPEQLKFETTGVCEGDNVDVNRRIQLSCKVELSKTTAAGTYDITCTKTGDPENYTIEIVNNDAKYTVNKKAVTVKIKDQNAVYNSQNEYNWDTTAWTVDESTPLANNEEASVLKVNLTKPELENAGAYPIAATYSNNNYDVTFEGAWQGEDENKGKAGVYTIGKYDLTAPDSEVNYTILLYATIGEETIYFSEQTPAPFVYSGTDIVLTADVMLGSGVLTTTVTPGVLNELGTYEVTVTITDINYIGSKKYSVDVVGADGYSETLSAKLAELAAAAGDLTAETLTATAENLAKVKAIAGILETIEDKDKQLGEAALEKYEDIVSAWQEAAAIDEDVIETAKAIGDSPIKWLYVAVAMNALVAAMYVVSKGGLLK